MAYFEDEKNGKDTPRQKDRELRMALICLVIVTLFFCCEGVLKVGA